MSFRLIHEAEAKSEFQEAVAWYEEQAEGLGVRFVGEVDKVMAAVSPCRRCRFHPGKTLVFKLRAKHLIDLSIEIARCHP